MFSMSFHLFAFCSLPSVLSLLIINPSLLLPLNPSVSPLTKEGIRGEGSLFAPCSMLCVSWLSALGSLLFPFRMTSAFVDIIQALFTFLTCISYPFNGIFSSSLKSFFSETPASTRAPRHMSPLIPEKQSRYAIFKMLFLRCSVFYHVHSD